MATVASLDLKSPFRFRGSTLTKNDFDADPYWIVKGCTAYPRHFLEWENSKGLHLNNIILTVLDKNFRVGWSLDNLLRKLELFSEDKDYELDMTDARKFFKKHKIHTGYILKPTNVIEYDGSRRKRYTPSIYDGACDVYVRRADKDNADKEECNRVFVELAKRRFEESDRDRSILILDSEICTTSVKLMEAGIPGRHIDAPNFGQDAVTSLTKVGVNSRKEYLSEYIDRSDTPPLISWLDYCGTFDGNKKQGFYPSKDIVSMFENKLIANGSIMALTVCRRGRSETQLSYDHTLHNWILGQSTKRGFYSKVIWTKSYGGSGCPMIMIIFEFEAMCCKDQLVSSSDGKPSAWTRHVEFPSCDCYYLNKDTDEVLWELPEGFIVPIAKRKRGNESKVVAKKPAKESFVGKRLNILWDMNDGGKQWFDGTVQKKVTNKGIYGKHEVIFGEKDNVWIIDIQRSGLEKNWKFM